jgi:hypothetical protein
MQVSQMYSWDRIAVRTEVVYESAMRQPHDGDLSSRVERLLGCGPVFGIVTVVLAALGRLWYRVVCWLDPADAIELARDFSTLSVLNES